MTKFLAQPYRNTAIFMLLIILGVQWGFYVPYTSQFPAFKDATIIIHIHGALLMTWLLLLVVQPMLIHMGKAKLHRKIGSISWVLGPAIIMMLFLVGKQSFNRGLGNFPLADSYAVMVLDTRGFISFAIIWALAMAFRKNPNAHMRYMIATGILGIGPGIGRGFMYFFGLSLWDALTYADLLDLVIVGLLLGFDIGRKRDYKPFAVVFLILLIGTILWQVRDSAAWQSFAAWYAGAFY